FVEGQVGLLLVGQQLELPAVADGDVDRQAVEGALLDLQVGALDVAVAVDGVDGTVQAVPGLGGDLETRALGEARPGQDEQGNQGHGEEQSLHVVLLRPRAPRSRGPRPLYHDPCRAGATIVSAMETLYLTEVRRLPDGRHLRLTWSDGHSADYEHDYLRAWCPCAGCQGHSHLKIRYQPPEAHVTSATASRV